MRLILLPLLLALPLLSAPAADWVALDRQVPPGTHPTVRVIAGDVTGTVLEILVPGFWAEKSPHGWKLRLPGRLVTTEEGRPEIPFVGCTLAMPVAGAPQVLLKTTEFVKPGTYTVRMAPRLETDTQVNIPPPPAAPARPYPEEPVALAYRGHWRDVPAVSLQIHPFRTTGAGEVLQVARRLVVEVTHPGAPGRWPEAVVDRDLQPLLRSLFVNGDRVPTTTAPLEAPATEYLVIANSALASAVQPLVDWRQKTGLQTELLSITSTSPTYIKSLINYRYTQKNLKYVLLVGDYAQIPWYVWNGHNSQSWYACLTGGSSPDLYPDVGLGRLSGTGAAEITRQVDRILAYEKYPYLSKTWHNRIILAAHGESGATGRFTSCCETIANGPLKTSGWTTTKQYGYLSSVTNTTLTNHINAGAGIVFYRGHGGSTSWSGWCPSSYTTSHVAALDNGSMVPLVFSICCTTGNFSYGNCFTEQWLRAKRGGIACIGATSTTYTSGNTPMAVEFCRAIFQDQTTNLADINAKGIAKALSVGGSGGQAAAYRFCWMGDTATTIFFRKPSSIFITKPYSILPGNQSINIKASQSSTSFVSLPAGTKICLYKKNEVFRVHQVVSSSNVTFMGVNPTSPGELYVTVTCQDYKPYAGLIPVVTPRVIPDGMARAEGSSSRHIPSRYAPNRSQHLYDAAVLKGLPTGYIRHLGLRRDGTNSSTYQAHYFPFTIQFSSTKVPTAAQASRTSYQANFGSDLKQVISGKSVYFPATAKPTTPPAGFTVKIPFDSGFYYTAGRNLLVQFDTTYSGDYYWYADAEYYSTSGSSNPASIYGRGCPTGRTLAGYAPVVNGSNNLYWYWYSGAGNSVPGLAFLGISRSVWGRTKLPLSLAPFGATGCYLNAEIALLFPGTTDPTGSVGRFYTSVPVPHDPALAGAAFYGQTLVVHPKLNPLGLAASEGLYFKLGAYIQPPPCLQLYTYNDRISDRPKYTGNYGLVLQLGM